MIPRTVEQLIHELLSGFPIVTVTGPRQSGKTTLVRKGAFVQAPRGGSPLKPHPA